MAFETVEVSVSWVAVIFPALIDAIGCVTKATTLLLNNETAPTFEKALPARYAPSYKAIAPLTTTLPLKTELAPIEKAPFTCQYTLHMEALLINITFVNAPGSKAPFIWKINMAFRSPS